MFGSANIYLKLLYQNHGYKLSNMVGSKGGATIVTKPLPFSIIFPLWGVLESYTEGSTDLGARNQDPRLSSALYNPSAHP